MDERVFGELTKRVARAGTRRGVVRVLGSGLAVSLLGMAGRGAPVAAAEVENEAFGFCTVPGQPCTGKTRCCAGGCRNGVCGCAKKGKSCFNKVGLLCCSRRCKKGKCK